jgi:PKD repeat protein
MSLLPALLALAVIVSGDGSTGWSPPTHAQQTTHPSHHLHKPPRQGSSGGTGAGTAPSDGPTPSGGRAGAPTGNTTGGRSIVPTGGSPGPAGGPVAYFVVTSPVAPGMPVFYTNESYDTTPGAAIVDTSWQGRQATFAQPGVYSVTLTVADTYGRRSAFTAQVLVSGTTVHAPAGKPHAFFLVTSPVTADSPVTFTDESYDMAPGARIVDEVWAGRQATYSVPGTYPVSLRVEDSTGAWSGTFVRDVVVLPGSASTQDAAPSPTPSRSTPTPWLASAAPDPATPGDRVIVTATAQAGTVGAPTLSVPAALQATWSGVSYAQANASGPMTAAGPGRFTRTLDVPDSVAFPLGTYDLTVVPPDGGQPVTVALVVQASTTYMEPIVAGA